MLLTGMRSYVSERWLRPALMLALLGAAAFLGMHASTTYLLGMLGLFAVVVFVKRLELGLVALLVAGLSVPFTIGTGTQTELNLAFLMVPALFALWLIAQLIRGNARIASSRVNMPLVALVASSLLSFVAGNIPWNYFAQTAGMPAQLGGLALFVFSVALFFVTANQIRDLRWLKVLCAILLGLGVLGVVVRAIPQVLPFATRVLPDQVLSGSLFWVWIVAMAGGQALFNVGLKWHWRVALFAFAVATVAIGLFFGRGWVSGWLPPLVALMALIWLRAPRLVAALTGLGILLINFQYPDLLTNLVQLKAYSIDTRIVAWQILIENIIPSSPILGLGPANYYFYTPLYPILGYYVNFNSHNQYVDLVAQIGLVGLAIFFWLMLSIARVGWELRHRVGDGFARGYVYACLGGLAGTLWAGMHGDWFIPFVYNIGIAGFRASMLGWLFLGGLIALEQIQRKRADVQDS